MDANLFPANDSACALFCLLDAESTVTIAEDLCLFFKHVRKDSFSVSSISFYTVSVHENIFLSGMTMEITKHNDMALIFKILEKPFQMKNDRVCVLLWVNPTSIQVDSSKCDSSVSINYSINIYHGHNLDQKVISEYLCSNRGSDQVIECPLHHV